MFVFYDFVVCLCAFCLFFVMQNTAYEMRISDWSSDVCSSDLSTPGPRRRALRSSARPPGAWPAGDRSTPSGARSRGRRRRSPVRRQGACIKSTLFSMPGYDPFDAAVAGDPYATYRWLRDEAPVHHSPVTDTFVLSRWDDVTWALNDHDLFSSDAMRGVLLGQDTGKGEQRLPREAATGNLVSIDPPGHSELRRIVSRGFTPRTMQA